MATFLLLQSKKGHLSSEVVLIGSSVMLVPPRSKAERLKYYSIALDAAHLMPPSQQVVDRLYRVECLLWYLHENSVPVGHSSVP